MHEEAKILGAVPDMTISHSSLVLEDEDEEELSLQELLLLEEQDLLELQEHFFFL